MAKRKRYSVELQQELVRLAREGRSPESLAKEFEPTAQAIRRWLRQAELDEGKRTDGLTTKEREELARLRLENARLKEEREILSKAAAWFAGETEKKSKRSSSSWTRTRPCSRSARCAECWRSPPAGTTPGAGVWCRHE